MRSNSECECRPRALTNLPRLQSQPSAQRDSTHTKRLWVHDHFVGYSDTGEGAPVILIHASASSREQWAALTKRLSNRYRVLAVDLHGYGSTQAWNSRTRFDIAYDVAIVAALVELIGEPVHLVGHAYGGTVCLESALELGSRILSMSLYEPAALHLLKEATEQAGWREIAELAERHIELTWEGDFDGSAQMLVNYLSANNTWSCLPRDQRLQYARHMPKVASEWLLALETDWRADRYLPIEVPTTLMYGTRTPRAAKQVVEELHKRLPESALIEIVGASHLAPITHSYMVNEVIDTHLWKHTTSFGGVC